MNDPPMWMIHPIEPHAECASILLERLYLFRSEIIFDTKRRVDGWNAMVESGNSYVRPTDL